MRRLTSAAAAREVQFGLHPVHRLVDATSPIEMTKAGFYHSGI